MKYHITLQFATEPKFVATIHAFNALQAKSKALSDARILGWIEPVTGAQVNPPIYWRNENV